MSKVIEMPKKARAPAVAEKLEAAKSALQNLSAEVGQAALEAAENAPGAARRLADLRSRISAAERDVDELTRAHMLAEKLDRQSDATAAAAMRAEQFAIMKKCAATRLKAVATVMEAIGIAGAAFSEYAIATNDMVIALPTGSRMPFIAMGKNGYAGSWVGDLKSLIAGEAFRVTVTDENGRGARLPFAQQPELTSDDPGTITPAIDVFTEAQNFVLRDIEGQIEQL